MERKHLYLGGAVLGLFAVVATVFIVTTSSAQTQTACTYSISPDLLNVTLEPGKQATSASVTVNTNSATGCVGIANVQVWDTPNQAVWPWASVWPVAMSDVSTATFTITFSPPATLTSTYDALFRVLLSDNTVAATNIIKFNVTPASCSGMNLSISPSTITKTNVPSEPVQLTYSCVSGGSVPSLTVQICPPGASGTQCETVNTLTNASSGTVTIPTSSYTTSGSYLVRTCMNDSTCATGTNSVSFNLAAGTTCSSGQYWCPQVSGSTQPAGCYVTCPTAEPAKSCANGEKCSSNSWCQNGSQCYYPTGELTCVAWPSNNTMGGGNYAECPVGTTECSPTDTSCISVGQIVPYVSGKWCRNGMQYYSTDGKNMTCVKMNTTAPAGFSSCRPDDTSCIPTGAYGPQSGWCSNGMQCYQKTDDSNPKNDKYCALNNYTTAGNDVVCPDGYSVCSSTDTGCKQKGDKWTTIDTSTWCSNSKKCSLPSGGGSCVGWNEECPSGTKYCDNTQINSGCLEPNEQKTFTTSGVYPYCGGSSGGMTLYSYTGSAVTSFTALCVARPAGSMMDMNWTPAVPSGFRFCRPNDTNCIEPGATGQASGWCGWMPPNSGPMSSGSATTVRACPPLAGYTPPADAVGTIQCATTGQISCSDSAGNRYCYTGTACPVIKPVVTCPAMPVAVCTSGQITKTMVNADGCSTTYCETETVTRKVCKEGEGFSPATTGSYATACMPPYFCWDGTKFVEKEPSYSVASINGGNLCASFRYEELEYHTLWAKKWDPAKNGVWYWPNYPETTPSYKLDSATNTLVSCTQGEYYPSMTNAVSEYRSPCQRMVEEDKTLWLTRFLAEKKMFGLWNKTSWPTEEPKPICVQMISFATDPTINKCKSFPTPCDIPKDWKQVSSCAFIQPLPIPVNCPAIAVAPICPIGHVQKMINGCPTNECMPAGLEPTPVLPIQPLMCRQYLRGYYDEVRGHRFYFRDVTQQISQAPERLKEELQQLKEELERGKTLAAKTEQMLKDAMLKGKCGVEVMKEIEVNLNIIRTEIIPLFKDHQDNLRVAQDCQFFGKNLKERVNNLQQDAKRFHRQGDEEFSKELLDLAMQFEALIPKASSACEALDSFSLDDVRFEMNDLERQVGDLFSLRNQFSVDRFKDAREQNIRSAMGSLRNQISMRGLDSKCQDVKEYLDKIEKLLADGAFNEAESLRDIVFDVAAQCGVTVTASTTTLADHRLLFENIAGFDEAAIQRMVDAVTEKVTARIEVFINEASRNLIAKAQEFEQNTLQQLIASVDNLEKVLAQKQEALNKLLAAKDELVVKVEDTLRLLKEKKTLSALERDGVKKAMEKAVVVVWCGDLSTEVTQKVELTRQALTTNELTRDDASAFVAFVSDAEARNPNYCYEDGISKFKDPGMSPEKWFFAYFHSEASPFKGRYDIAGKPLGLVDYGRKALWMEGAVAMARVAGVPNVDAGCDVPSAIPGANAVPYGACALDYFVDHDVPLPTHSVSEMMTRGELASLIVALTGDRLPIKGGKSYVGDYKDVQYKSMNGPAISTVIANKIMFGKSDGVFAPNETPTRAELAAVIARLSELFKLTGK